MGDKLAIAAWLAPLLIVVVFAIHPFAAEIFRQSGNPKRQSVGNGEGVS